MPNRDQRLLKHARELRRNMTYSETLLWNELRGGQLGVRFRRQEPIGPFIADFVCRRVRLVVEADGWSHRLEQTVPDEDRDRWMEERGWMVLRFEDEEVWRDLDGVVGEIADVVEERSQG